MTTANNEKESRLRHVAIIMDGNRRWAKQRHMPTLMGHQQGVNALKELVRHCGDIGVEALTVYAFSTENWKRSEEEVGYLLSLFVEALGREIQHLHKNNVQLAFIGDVSPFHDKLKQAIADSEALTRGNTGLKFRVAANYGSHAEMVRACRLLAEQARHGTLDPTAIDEAAIEAHLYTSDLPPLDLLIRTGGETRLSNYLLWQAAYAEILFTETLWPDFSASVFDEVVAEFLRRERRFGS